MKQTAKVILRLAVDSLPTFGFQKKLNELKVWGTKGFEFWTFLSLFLLEAKPQSILELGSGRSTITLGEYAKYSRAHLDSLETNKSWFEKSKVELHAARVPDGAISLIQIDKVTGWYEIGAFQSTISQGPPYDFALIDGPNKNNGKSLGIRDAPIALDTLRKCLVGTTTVIVDDVHRRHVLNSVDLMMNPASDYEKYFYDYRVHDFFLNTLCICVKKDSGAHSAVPRLADLLGIAFYSDYPQEKCPEE